MLGRCWLFFLFGRRKLSFFWFPQHYLCLVVLLRILMFLLFWHFSHLADLNSNPVCFISKERQFFWIKTNYKVFDMKVNECFSSVACCVTCDGCRFWGYKLPLLNTKLHKWSVYVKKKRLYSELVCLKPTRRFRLRQIKPLTWEWNSSFCSDRSICETFCNTNRR